MPIWNIDCDCGCETSRRMSYDRRVEEYGDNVPCSACGTVVPVRPGIGGFSGVEINLHVSQIGRTFTTAADLDNWAHKNNKEVISPTSSQWRSIADASREGKEAQAREEGYSSVEEKRRRHSTDRVERVRQAQQAKIDNYHSEHGESGRKTVEEAFGSVPERK